MDLIMSWIVYTYVYMCMVRSSPVVNEKGVKILIRKLASRSNCYTYSLQVGHLALYYRTYLRCDPRYRL